jgi:hypothetical protein
MELLATDTAPSIPSEARRIPRVLLFVLLAVGFALAFVSRHVGIPGNPFWIQWAIVGATLMVSLVPAINRNFAQFLDRARNPSPRTRALATLFIWLFAIAYLFLTAQQQHRDLFPRIHDECSYTIQARMMSQGRLWEPQHPLTDFFETFHFLSRPVYGSIYFPGTALINVPGVWLGEGSWFIPLLLAAGVIAMSFRVTAELLDGAAGLLVALLVLATCMFRVFSTMVMSQIPVMLLGLCMAWAWLHWRRARHPFWAAAVGAFAGWAAITRPVDAVAFALPIGLAMFWDLRRQSKGEMIRSIAALVVGAMPFLAIQAVFDWKVTGSPLKTPYVSYLEQNQPGSVFGSTPAEMHRAQTELPQKRLYFAQLAMTEKAERRAGWLRWCAIRLQMAAAATMPFVLLLALVPAGIPLARRQRSWVMLLPIPLFLIGYALNPFFLLHYAVPLGAGVAFCAVLGAKAIEASTDSRYLPFIRTFLTGSLAMLAITSLPQLNRHVSDEPYRTPLLDRVEKALAEIPPPAVVFFRYSPGANVHEEPVYNIDVTWPDEAPVVRAQDLGPRNGELIRYYSRLQPERQYYVMDRKTGILLALGDAEQAAATLHVPFAPSRTATADAR